MEEEQKLLITMTLTSEQIAIAKTAMEQVAHELGPSSLIGAECMDTAEYMTNPANWSVSLR